MGVGSYYTMPQEPCFNVAAVQSTFGGSSKGEQLRLRTLDIQYTAIRKLS